VTARAQKQGHPLWQPDNGRCDIATAGGHPSSISHEGAGILPPSLCRWNTEAVLRGQATLLLPYELTPDSEIQPGPICSESCKAINFLQEGVLSKGLQVNPPADESGYVTQEILLGLTRELWEKIRVELTDFKQTGEAYPLILKSSYHIWQQQQDCDISSLVLSIFG